MSFPVSVLVSVLVSIPEKKHRPARSDSLRTVIATPKSHRCLLEPPTPI
jgi:hypothetical protein